MSNHKVFKKLHQCIFVILHVHTTLIDLIIIINHIFIFFIQSDYSLHFSQSCLYLIIKQILLLLLPHLQL